MVGAVQTTETSGSGGSAETTKTEHECTSEGRNSETGHIHPDRDTALRVCDWSDSGRNSLAVLRALGRFDGGEAGVNSGEDPASSYKTRRSLTEERRLLTLCREPASDKESQPERPARRARSPPPSSGEITLISAITVIAWQNVPGPRQWSAARG